MTSARVAAIPGDGIGTEVMDSAKAVLARLLPLTGDNIAWTDLDWSCERYLTEGALMPDDGLGLLREHDAVLLGAVGWPGVPDHVSLWGLLIPIRRMFQQYVNLRPVRVMEGVPSPLRPDLAEGVDLLIVRENSEGEYSEIGGRFGAGTPVESAFQQSVFTRTGVERIARFAAERAERRRGRIVAATKSNGIIHTMPFWDEVVAETTAHYSVETTFEHIDALAAKLVLHPARYDVVLGSNLFGDILSDLAAGVCGSIGIAPSANVDPTGTYPSMFEPVHGSAPDIAGRGIANPVGMLWSTVMMLEHLGAARAAGLLMEAIAETLRDPATRTADIGGTADTAAVTDAVISHVTRSAA
ncbi:tartrate dehydrogenase [Occultella glacieicola]|uniref:D-malate dehydrogenase (decarboxylating) n=1 Tax=Occultella glacieicola TaxID=2518684 RepID=A0ABY2DX63_9MICO|nr:tartrate dehydrogenase [Occultella glacieicola]TDE88539.1 tartrate dehydrogenase [Occultella glacieicola]